MIKCQEFSEQCLQRLPDEQAPGSVPHTCTDTLTRSLLGALPTGSSLGPLLPPGKNLMARSQDEMTEEPETPSPLPAA